MNVFFDHRIEINERCSYRVNELHNYGILSMVINISDPRYLKVVLLLIELRDLVEDVLEVLLQFNLLLTNLLRTVDIEEEDLPVELLILLRKASRKLFNKECFKRFNYQKMAYK
jgi:hypothetical protein